MTDAMIYWVRIAEMVAYMGTRGDKLNLSADGFSLKKYSVLLLM
jgi:hypothetical protein